LRSRRPSGCRHDDRRRGDSALRRDYEEKKAAVIAFLDELLEEQARSKAEDLPGLDRRL
jgi:hypothetical protein